MIKTPLVRTVIIREYDYNRLITGPARLLYDSYSFDPLLREALEKDYAMCILRGRGTRDFEINTDEPILNALRSQSDRLYNTRYLSYQLTEDNSGFVWIQSRPPNPISRLGLAKFVYCYGQ
jgi:hypothetical protein